MITKFRACWWALSFALFFHISMDERHNPLASICIAVFWTAVVDRITTGAVDSAR